MPILRKKEIKNMKPEDLNERLIELETELMRLRGKIHAGGAIENPGRIRALKRTLARIKTSMREVSKS
ncbi:MAG: 50S ribosomal protein L29 [Candidatus Bathyarchaeia archaeon]|nr:50S ribosomal protein L29 [Candidatus Bathyarchaeota archaeon]